MSWWKILLLAVVFVFLSFGIYNLVVEKKDLSKEISDLKATLNNYEKENNNLNSKIEYFNHPENLLKELKSQSNYRNPSEKLIIIVPSSTQSR